MLAHTYYPSKINIYMYTVGMTQQKGKYSDVNIYLTSKSDDERPSLFALNYLKTFFSLLYQILTRTLLGHIRYISFAPQ